MHRALKCFVLAVAVVLLAGLAMARDQVPYKATLASTSVTILPPGVEGNNCPLTIPGLPEGFGIFQFVITAVGHSTLMGLTADVQSHCVPMPLDPNAPPPPIGAQVPFFDGVATMTGANGDTIFGTYFGVMSVTEQGLVIDGTMLTTGGTGRLTGATGSGKAYGVQTLSGDSALTMTGTLSSPGSLKK